MTEFTTSISKILPDGSKLEKFKDRIILTGPQGKTMVLAPIPQYSSSNEDFEYRESEDGIMIEKEGWLDKLSHRKSIWGYQVWQRRYVKLKNSELSYYNSDTDISPNKRISLGNKRIKINFTYN